MLLKTAMFSVIVAAFFLEGYKKLSPDPNDRNAFYLRQVSQQIASFASESTFVPSQDYSPHPPSIAIVWVNAVWMLSLLFSIMPGLFSIFHHQCAPRYLQLLQHPHSPPN